MSHVKHAKTDHPIEKLLSLRWSPYSFADKDISPEDLRALFEAVRWAPSSYNEQPWRYIVARRLDSAAFGNLLSCLVEANQIWARHAPVLAIGVAMLNFARNGKPNKAAFHDLGLAAGNLGVEATARGLCLHQMIGIFPERARELYKIPDEAEAFTALAIGYPGDGRNLPEDLQARDRSPRSRRPGTSIVFEGTWGEPAGFAKA
ncbi:MAG: nitroreductase family protein [Acidobacteriota bacterium]